MPIFFEKKIKSYIFVNQINHMKQKLIVNWLLMLFASFFLYEVLWLLIDCQFEEPMLDGKDMIWDLAQCGLFTFVVFIVNRFYDKWNRGRFAKSLIEIVTVLIINMLIIFLMDKVLNVEENVSYVNFWSVIDIYIICIISTLLSIIDIQHFYNKKINDMKKKQARLRLSLLQQQLSPHFMFNSLSVLKGIIVTEPQKAEEYVDALSRVLRYITENVGKETVSLTDACFFIENFIKMMNDRFPGHFRFHIDADNMSSDGKIIPVSLQLAIENAIKHNNHSCKCPLEINIVFNNTYVEVSNKIQCTAVTDEGIGIGLKNLNERYILLINKGLYFGHSKDYYTIKIPLIYESTNRRR